LRRRIPHIIQLHILLIRCLLPRQPSRDPCDKAIENKSHKYSRILALRVKDIVQLTIVAVQMHEICPQRRFLDGVFPDVADIVGGIQRPDVLEALVQEIKTGVLELACLYLVGEDEKVNGESVLVLLLVIKYHFLRVEPGFEDFEVVGAVVWEVDRASL